MGLVNENEKKIRSHAMRYGLSDKTLKEAFQRMCDTTKEDRPSNLRSEAGLYAAQEQLRSARPSLMERLDKTIQSGRTEAYRVDRAMELGKLLHKYPDFAKMLELYEEFREPRF